jgi:hypothetical protein
MQTDRRRIPLDQLRKEFAAACPELAEQADRRSRLAQLLQSTARPARLCCRSASAAGTEPAGCRCS